jgi:hypothetical protein
MARRNPFARARRDINKSERELREDRMADYRFADSREDAIFNALTRSLRRTGQRVSRQNERMLERMAALVARQRAGRRVIGRAQGAAVDSYGGAMAGEAADAFSVARTSARTGVQVAQAHERAGEQGARNADRIVRVAQAGAREARAGADYALAQALDQRGTEDAALIAQQRHDLNMARIQQQFAMAQAERQHQLDFEFWKKQQNFLQNGGFGQDGQSSSLVGEDLASLMPNIRDLLEANPDASATDILQQLGENVTPEQVPYVMRLIQTVKNRGLFGGPSPSGTYEEGVQAIVDSMLASNPEWDKPKLRRALEKAILAQLRMVYNQRASEAPEAPDTAEVGPGLSQSENFGVTSSWRLPN